MLIIDVRHVEKIVWKLNSYIYAIPIAYENTC